MVLSIGLVNYHKQINSIFQKYGMLKKVLQEICSLTATKGQ